MSNYRDSIGAIYAINRIETDSSGSGYTHYGFAATPDGFVHVQSMEWETGQAFTRLIFIHRGRQFERDYDEAYQPRYLVTLAKRFAAEVTTQHNAAPDAQQEN